MGKRAKVPKILSQALQPRWQSRRRSQRLLSSAEPMACVSGKAAAKGSQRFQKVLKSKAATAEWATTRRRCMPLRSGLRRKKGSGPHSSETAGAVLFMPILIDEAVTPPMRSVTIDSPKAEPIDNARKDPDEWLSGADAMTGAKGILPEDFVRAGWHTRGIWRQSH